MGEGEGGGRARARERGRERARERGLELVLWVLGSTSLQGSGLGIDMVQNCTVYRLIIHDFVVGSQDLIRHYG